MIPGIFQRRWKKMKTELEKMQKFLNNKQGELEILQKSLNENRKNRKNAKLNLTQSEKAQKIIQEVAQQTQEQIKFHIEDIVTMALDVIFPDPYQFELEFVVKRNKTECEMWCV